MDHKITTIEFVFRISNNTDEVFYLSVFNDQESANGEQVSFFDYTWKNDTWVDENLNDRILPGSVLGGGLYTGFERSEWNEVNKIVISMSCAVYLDGYCINDDFLFSIDVVDWMFEEFPDL